MASDDTSDGDNIHLDWRDDEVSLVNNTYKFDAESPFEDDDYQDDEDDVDASSEVSAELHPSTVNPLRQGTSEDDLNSQDLLTDLRNGYTFNSHGPKSKTADHNSKKHITISSNSVNSAASRFALAQQNYSPAVFEFTADELVEMTEKTKFELRRDRRQKQGDVLKSKFIQEQLKDIRFFPDTTLNRLMSKLLLRLHYVKEAIRVTMYIFFDVAMFKEHYVPSPSGPSGISNNKPFPKYERFHAFWSSIHCNDTAFCAKYTKGCIDANSNYRKIALTGSVYTGYVSHRPIGPAGSYESIKASPITIKSETVTDNKMKRSIIEGPSSSKRFKVNLPQSSSVKSSPDPSNSSNPGSMTNSKVSYDANGHAFYKTSNGNIWFIRDPKASAMTFNQFYTPSRLLLMKARAHHIWNCVKHKLLESRDVCWFSGASMTDVAKKIENLDHFPDENLNVFMKRLINHNITLSKVLKITIYVFFSTSELSKESIPPSANFSRVMRPPVPGYELFHEFWNYLFDTQNSSERRKRFEGAFSEVYKVFSSPGMIPELPF